MKKFKLVAAIAATILTGLMAGHASAAYITSFSQTSNDGIYTLSASQATALGVTGADRIGSIGIRTTSGLFSIGDTFDAASLFNSTNNDASIVGFLNGISPSAGYIGSAGDPLGLTTISAYDRMSDRKLFDAVFFAFNSTSGNIVFNGTSTFNGTANVRGDFASILPARNAVPEPATVMLFGAGIAGVGAMRRRRKAA